MLYILLLCPYKIKFIKSHVVAGFGHYFQGGHWQEASKFGEIREVFDQKNSARFVEISEKNSNFWYNSDRIFGKNRNPSNFGLKQSIISIKNGC